MMNTKGFAFLLLVCGIAAQAEFQSRPDANTLWRENGKTIAVAPNQIEQAWDSGNLKIEAAPGDTGFTVTALDPKKYATTRYVPFDPDYPWFVYEITGVEQQKGYTAYSFFFTGTTGNSFGQTAAASKGTFAVRLFDNKTPPQVKQTAFRFNLYGQSVTFAYWQQVKEPANYILAESVAFDRDKKFSSADTVKFTVKLEKPAEDVTLRLFNPYMMKPLTVNQQDKLQLKPADADCKIWSVELKINSLTGSMMQKMPFILMKAVILGGELPEPLWGAIYYPYQ